MTVHPRCGELVYVGPDAGAQFRACPMYARIIRIFDRSGWEGMAWVDVYQLDEHGVAFDRRDIYVILAGLRTVEGTLPDDALPKTKATKPRHAETRNARPPLPKQRITTTPRPARRTR